MAYLAFYRKYRPQKFEDMSGQAEIINVIKNEVLNEKISHAYLFSGPRGTGKTTTAKILARMVNCSNLLENGSPCGQCEFCNNFDESNDVIEIDAASNNGVDEIRNIRDKVNLVPSKCKYKVYIIDEVHMLTTQAFNALLKTLEEPPKHVIFILATTEFYKIPVTVISRCQKFQFEKVTNDDIVTRLRYICEQESIIAEDQSLYEIAKLSDGGMRDAINMLDQLSSFSNGNIKLDDVFDLGGIYSYDLLANLLFSICDNNFEQILSFCDSINSSGKNIAKFMEEFILFIKDIILYKNSNKKDNLNVDYEKFENLDINVLFEIIMKLNDCLFKIKKSEVPNIMISIYLMQISSELNKQNLNDINNIKMEEKVEKKEKKEDISNKIVKSMNDRKEEIKKVTINKNLIINNTFATASKKKLEFFKEKFKRVNDYLIDKDYSYEAGLLKDTEIIVCGNGYVMLKALYSSLIDRINNDYTNVNSFISKLFDENFKFVVLSNDEWEYLKNQYIANLKSGKQYVLMDDNKQIENGEEKNDDEEKIIEILGKDMIEYV